ncbi:MAG TPA: sigma-70 family RNA polymerase sigma factor [Acidimicrobiales bacterium]|nr:sigma-70 family RNA polymerase sigma factor [Acidimicrobiales bacterium]
MGAEPLEAPGRGKSSGGGTGSEDPAVIPDLAGASDTNLAMAVARWHEDALAEIYRRHAGAVFGLARRLLVDRALAEEVTQEVFVRLWQQPERYDPARGTLRTFLLSVAHGRAIDLLRSEASRRAREERSRAVAEAGYDLEQEVFELANAERVRQSLAKLSDAERTAIELAYFGGHSYREVAEMQNQPEGTIKSRIRSGLRKMERELSIVVQGGGR